MCLLNGYSIFWTADYYKMLVKFFSKIIWNRNTLLLLL